MTPLFHLALAGDWEAAGTTGEYRVSTIGRSLDDVGFIHCSSAHQYPKVAQAFYTGRDDVVLLTIDPALVGAEIRIENLDGGDELFPHLYGPLPVAAVIAAEPYRLDLQAS